MRILLTLHHERSDDTGVGRVTRALAGGYRAAGHDVDVLGFEDLPARIRGMQRWVVFPWFVAARLRRDAGVYDVVDASTGDLWVYASRAAGRRRRPLLVTRSHGLETVNHAARKAAGVLGHGSLPGRLYHHRYRLWEVRRSLRVSDAVAVLNATERQVVRDLGVPAERIRVVDHGIGDHLLGQPPPAVADGPLGIAFLGAHGHLKGSPVVVRALEVLLREDGDRHATLLGTNAPAEVVLDGLSPNLRTRVRVVPAFANRDLPRLLAGHHVLLAPAIGEGFGLGVLEAMACGLAPVIGSAPGPRRLVTADLDGVVLDEPTVDRLVAVVRALDGDRGRLIELRRRAHATAQHYTWRRTVDDQLTWFAQLRDQPATAA